MRSFFFFSSRRRHTRYIGDWSSDVCSSDLVEARAEAAGDLVTACEPPVHAVEQCHCKAGADGGDRNRRHARSEERRVGKERRAVGAASPSENRTGATAPPSEKWVAAALGGR